jgi:hypothetical protein
MVIDPDVDNTVEPPAELSPACKTVVNNIDMQSHLLDKSLLKDQPYGSNCTRSTSSMCNVNSEPNLLDQSPGTNNVTDTSQLSSAALAILMMDAEQLHQQNEVMDRETFLCTPRTVDQQLQVPQGSISSLLLKRQTLFGATPLSSGKVANQEEQLHQQNEVMDRETILHTPRTVDQQLQAPQGSISSLRLKRQKLFSATPLSSGEVANQEAYSLVSEFAEHGNKISALKNALKTRLQESPAASRLPLASNSVPRRQLKKTSESFILGTRTQVLNEATKVQDTSCRVLTLDSQPSHECNPFLNLDGAAGKETVKENGHAMQESPEEIAEAARNPMKSRKEISCVSQSSVQIEGRQNDAHDQGQLVNVDRDKVKVTSLYT